MRAIPPDKPEFLCGRCSDVLCDDCASIAAEYEFLYVQQKYELARLQDELKVIMDDRDRWQRRSEGFEHVAKIGYTEVITGYLDQLARNYEKTL